MENKEKNTKIAADTITVENDSKKDEPSKTEK